MTDLNLLRERIERLETEIESVIGESEKLQRAHRRNFVARLALNVFPTLLLFASWSLARGQGDVVHAPFLVNDSDGGAKGSAHAIHTIFAVNNDHSFYVHTENSTRALTGYAGKTESYFMVAPSNRGQSVKLGLEGSGPSAPVAPSPAPTRQQGGRRGRRGSGPGRGGSGRGQGGGAGAGAAGMVPFLKVSSGGQSETNERIALTVDGTPELVMRNTNGIKVFDLLQGKAFPGGELGLFNVIGQIAVRAGSSAAGIGRVEAFPLGNPIGSSIVGRVR
jgi:hypothetical protein